MPFQSEKQRRYLWANEPEIARDWTDTYGSGIAKALGGRIGFYRGSDRHAGTGASQSQAPSSGPHGGGGGGTKSAPSHSPDRDGPAHLSHNAPAPYQDRIQRIAAQNKRTTDLRNRAGGEGFHQFLNKPGPQLGFAGSGVGGGLGNWASGLAGSKIGGGLGSILFGPIGMLLGSLFGQGVGRRAYKASQTDEKETMKQILTPEFMQNLGLFDKRIKEPPRGEGLGGIDLSDMRDKFNQPLGDKPSEKMYWDEQEIPMPKDLDADITELENWMSENPQQVQQKHINFVQALKTAKHNKMREANPNLPGTRVRQLWE